MEIFGSWSFRAQDLEEEELFILSWSGKALDVEVMSKPCKECTVWRSNEGTQELQDWWEGHHNLCEANHLGTSGSMDATDLLAINQCSVGGYSVRYTEFLRDGDNKAHKLIVEEAVYLYL